MALIEITVDRPSLISTGEDERRPTDEQSDEAEPEAAVGEPDDDEGLGDAMKTVSTLLTAVTTIAGVLKQLRSEDEDVTEGESAVETAEELFEDETTDGEDEAESFEESVVDEDIESEDAENEAETDVDEDASGSGLGLKVAFVLVVVLIAAAVWMRGDEESDDDWD